MNAIKLTAAFNSVRSKSWINTFVILTRYLIGFAFIPSGLKKIMGERFTQISIDNPIGLFFEALYMSGAYWNFIGWAQVIAALLLMTQRFATLGAICFFFIVSNIWVITISLHFSGTWVITSLLLMAVIMLLAWDYHKLKYIFFGENYSFQPVPANMPTYNRTWIITGFILFAWSIGGMLFLEQLPSPKRLASSIWLGGILFIVGTSMYTIRQRLKIQAS